MLIEKSSITEQNNAATCQQIDAWLTRQFPCLFAASGYYREALRPVIRKIINQLEART